MRALALMPLALLLAGCQPVDPVGYVEVKRLFAPGPNDLFRLNGLALADLSRNNSVVIKQKTGPAKLELDRQGNLSPLCSFDVGRNRIVTATLSVVDGRLKCGVQL